jgi:hypothetical protein
MYYTPATLISFSNYIWPGTEFDRSPVPTFSASIQDMISAISQRQPQIYGHNAVIFTAKSPCLVSLVGNEPKTFVSVIWGEKVAGPFDFLTKTSRGPTSAHEGAGLI